MTGTVTLNGKQRSVSNNVNLWQQGRVASVGSVPECGTEGGRKEAKAVQILWRVWLCGESLKAKRFISKAGDVP